MPRTLFKGRKAFSVENDSLRVNVLEEGGHIAEVFDKRSRTNPLWIPHWQSIEPSVYSQRNAPEFGTEPDAKLLAGIMGHNLCLDLFGGPSAAEAAAGVSAHGESSVDCYDIKVSSEAISLSAKFPLAQLAFTRIIELNGPNVRIRETVENLTAMDRPIAWTQHVTLAPPFLDPATTEFRASMTHSMVSELDPGENAYLAPGATFEWPIAPSVNGNVSLTQMNPHSPASGYTAHLADPAADEAFFVAFSPIHKLAFGYVWKRSDFPWLGIWEENRSRKWSPWNSMTVTRGMEFGVSPFPESRIETVERGRLFGERTYRWLPALSRLDVEYWIVTRHCDEVPHRIASPAR